MDRAKLQAVLTPETDSGSSDAAVAAVWKRIAEGVKQDLELRYEVEPKRKGELGATLRRK